MRVRLVRETEIRLIDERGGLQGVVRPFTPHVAMSELAQLVIDQGREFIGLGALPITGGRQQIADLLRGRRAGDHANKGYRSRMALNRR